MAASKEGKKWNHAIAILQIFHVGSPLTFTACVYVYIYIANTIYTGGPKGNRTEIQQFSKNYFKNNKKLHSNYYDYSTDIHVYVKKLRTNYFDDFNFCYL